MVHLTRLLAALTYAYYRLWHEISGTWHWFLLGFLAYIVWGMPSTIYVMRRTLHTYWNAPDTAKKNQKLVE